MINEFRSRVFRIVLTAGFLIASAGVIVLPAGCEVEQKGVRMGATVEEVEKELGDPISVLPNFGREQRIYKAKSGKKYMITFEEDKVVEIH